MATRSDATSDPPGGVPELELDVRAAPKPKPKPKRGPEPEKALELAVDPRALVVERSDAASSAAAPRDHGQAPLGATDPLPPLESRLPDLASDARLLADFGDLPRHWLRSPLYAWRVLNRWRALTAALIGRRSEAASAANQLETAIQALAVRARPTAEKTATYVLATEELQRAEEVLKAREGLLAEERDAHKARLSLMDERLTNLQTELAQGATEAQGNAKKRGSEAQKLVEVARSERTSLEQWLKRQGESRAAAVNEAREHVTRQMVALGKRVMSDRGAFGTEFDSERDEIARLQSVQLSAARDVLVHEAALVSQDGRSFRQGLIVTAVLVLVLIVAPIVWRATRVVEPPSIHVVTGQ